MQGDVVCTLPPSKTDRLWRPPRAAAFVPAALRTRKGRTLEVREYGLGCFGALVEMYDGFQPKRVAQGLPPPDVPRIVDWLHKLQQKSRSLLAMDRNQIVAHAILCPISGAAVEYVIFVHQDYRREKLGTALTRLAIAFAGEMGFREVFVTTELSNFGALRLLRNVGFHVTSSSGGEYEMKLSVASVRGTQPEAA